LRLTPAATLFFFAMGSVAASASGFQSAQTGAVPAADRTFRVSVNLVQVDAIVTDSKGHHVTDLRPEDFEVTEDGKLQKITNFSWVEVEPRQGTPNPAVPGTARGLRKEDVRRSIVLMIDDTGPWAEQDVLPVITAARNFVAGQMAPGDLVSVTASRGGMGFYQQFTSDKHQLNAAIDRIAQRPGFGRWTVAPPTMLDDSGLEVPMPLAPGEPPYSFRGGDAPNPFGYLSWAIQGLQNSPGRKAVVLFSHSFAAPASLVDLANRAGVVIYVIDPHGTDLKMVSRATPHGIELNVSGQMATGVAPYRMLAKRTGGLFILSAPGADLNNDLGKVLEDMSGYYLIGYQADRSDLEVLQERRVHHDIQVKVRGKGLTARARNGFMGAPDTAASGPVPHTSGEYLQQAVFSPFSAGEIRLRVDATYAASRPDPKTALRQPLLRTRLQADGRDLRFTDTGGGQKKLVYSVLIAVFNQDGTPAANRVQTFTLTLTPGEASRVTASGLHTSIEVKLARAGPYQIRAAVRDENAGTMGSAYTFLEVPDFNGPQLALSNIALSSPGGTREGTGAGWDEYLPGSSIGFECEVFGFRSAPRPPKAPRVEMQIRLFKEGGRIPVFDSQVLPVPQATLAENYLAGRMGIGSDFAPGDYTMQLVVYDRSAAAKKQIATQWTNLTVASPAGR
jgi:VWFA-related protein